jgi:hypothetical protein
MNREEPSTESRSFTLLGTVVFRTSYSLGGLLKVHLIVTLGPERV